MSKGVDVSVTVVGAEQFRAALLRAEEEIGAIVHTFFEGEAHRIEVEAKRRMASQFVGSDNTGNLLRSFKSDGGSITEPAIHVEFGGDQVPYAGWWEFGGDTNSPRGDTYREIVPGGRSLYPAVRALSNEIDLTMAAILDELVTIIATTDPVIGL